MSAILSKSRKAVVTAAAVCGILGAVLFSQAPAYAGSVTGSTSCSAGFVFNGSTCVPR
ncbi:hypothetical protein [Streptomyces sp. NBC_01314]|uniref:hypothetical protein n=1 Tax=Streptomyces sp. NBC_01314 TaxID=2903821 RepID=UPI00308668F8|nr:hypothetical protein OG622_28935 [Streptomyces sp. NBC_01314]